MPNPRNETSPPKLPFPGWVFVLLALPTFFMPVVWIITCGWAMGSIFLDKPMVFPEWFKAVGEASLWVCFVLWPIYIVWAACSKRLDRKEKLYWIGIIFLLNMVGMPIFFVFMLRLYLGYAKKIKPCNELAAERLLISCGLKRDDLASSQWQAIVRYSNRFRVVKLSVPFMILVGLLMMYMSLVVVPRISEKFAASSLVPTNTVIIDSAKNTKKEIKTDPETKSNIAKVHLLLGAYCGLMGACGMFFILEAVIQPWGNMHRVALIDFLKATPHKTLEGSNECDTPVNGSSIHSTNPG